MARYKLLYRYSTDNGISWTDLTPAVDSSKTTITQNICTNSFKSAKDSATFTLPATSEAVKDSFLNALLGTSEVLVEICGPGPVSVMWGDDDARWGDLEVLWEGRVPIFTGYVDRSNISLKSYPFPTSITVTVNDVSSLKLDDKVNRHVDLQNKTVTKIVWYLLYLSGYATETQKDNPPTSILSTEDMTLEAFVIDKDSSDTYRSYIDTLLFEVGGYVLDFDETGTPRIVRLQWDSTTGYTEVDNPLISEGISTKTALLEEDGVSLKWSTLSTTSEKEVVWMDSISRKYEDGVLIGDQVENGHYWPEDGDIEPVYQEYVENLMDTPYLVKDTRKQNKDISIIAVREVEAVIAAQKGSEQFTAWTYQIPEGFGADYGLTQNPSTWPTKAWYLLYNNSGETVNLQMMELRGKVTYRSKINTSKTENTENPKEYTSQYIFSKTDAERFMTFYWNFLQTSKTTVAWKEPNSERNLGDVVRLSHKGLENSQYYAVISGKTESWIGFTKITFYTAVGISETHETVTIKTQGTASSAAVTAQDGKSVTTTTLYALSESSVIRPSVDSIGKFTNPIEPETEFKHGDYLWSQIVETDGDGNETVRNTHYDSNLTTTLEAANTLVIDVSPSTWKKNLRANSNDKNNISVTLLNLGRYDYDSLTVVPSIGSYSSGILEIPKTNSSEACTLSVVIKKGTRTLAEEDITLQAIDETTKIFYHEKQSNPIPTTSIDGVTVIEEDCCVSINDHFLPYVYHANQGGWIRAVSSEKHYSEILAKCQKDSMEAIIASSTEEITASPWAFFDTMIANQISAIDISTENIHSNNYDEESGVGYSFNGQTGSGFLGGDITIKGVVESPALTTTTNAPETHALAGQISSTATAKYNYSEYILPVGFGNPVSASGIYMGKTISKYRGGTSEYQITIGSASSATYDYTYSYECKATGSYRLHVISSLWIYVYQSWFVTRGSYYGGAMSVTDTTTGTVVWSTGIYSNEGVKATEVPSRSTLRREQDVWLNLIFGHTYQIKLSAAPATPTGGLSTSSLGGSFSLYDDINSLGFYTNGGFVPQQSGWRTEVISNITIDGASQTTPTGKYNASDFVFTEDSEIKLAGSYKLVSGSSVSIDGTAYELTHVSWSETGASFLTSEGSFQYDENTYVSRMTFSGNSMTSNGEVQTTNLMPKANNTYSLGTPEKSWTTGYFIVPPQGGCSRVLKKNIEEYSGNGLDILSRVKVVTYNYKTETDTHHKHILFIAEDSPLELTGDGKGYVPDNVDGVLIKAIQELSAKVKDLESRLQERI